MSNATDQIVRAEILLQRQEAGETLTAVEHADLAVYWADRAVAAARWGKRLAAVSIALALVGFALALISIIA